MVVDVALKRLFERSNLVSSGGEPVLVSLRRPFQEADGLRLRTRSTSFVIPVTGEEQVSFNQLLKSELRLGNFQLGITVGRADGNDIVIPDASVSRLHGYFVWDKKRRAWRIFDAESRNGTWLNDVRVAPNVPSAPTDGELMSDGAWIRLGKVDLLFLLPETVALYMSNPNSRNH